MPDPSADALIELAYESLVDARTATLLIEGVGRVGADTTAAITLCERAGRPVLLCPTSGELARLAADGCAAVLTVPTPALAETAGTVIFLGRLQSSGTYGSGEERTTMLELAPASIVIEPEAAGASHEHVDLPRYTAHYRRRGCRIAACVPLDAVQLQQIAERIRVHSNHHHQTQLVDAVTRLAGHPGGSVAGARLADVDPSGLVLEWTDEAGGHRLSLSFTSPASDPAGLSSAVREVLEGRR